MEIGVPSLGTRHFRLKGLIYWHILPSSSPVNPELRLAQAPGCDIRPGSQRPIPLAFIFLTLFILE